MYGIFTYSWAIFGVNVGKYSIHGAYGISRKNPLPINNQAIFLLIQDGAPVR